MCAMSGLSVSYPLSQSLRSRWSEQDESSRNHAHLPIRRIRPVEIPLRLPIVQDRETKGHVIAFFVSARSELYDAKRGWSWFSRNVALRATVDEGPAGAKGPRAGLFSSAEVAGGAPEGADEVVGRRLVEHGLDGADVAPVYVALSVSTCGERKRMNVMEEEWAVTHLVEGEDAGARGEVGPEVAPDVGDGVDAHAVADMLDRSVQRVHDRSVLRASVRQR